MNDSEFDQDQKPFYKIIILGLSKTGKTKLLTRYKYGTYSDQGITTIGVDSFKFSRSQASFNYFDTAGQDKYRAIVDSYYRDSDACIIAYDISSQKSFQEISFYYNKVKELAPESLIFIVGCKGDLQCNISEQSVKKLYRGYKHDITSAKTNQNVKQFFNSVQDDLLKLKKKNRSTLKKAYVLSEHQGQNQAALQKKKCCK